MPKKFDLEDDSSIMDCWDEQDEVVYRVLKSIGIGLAVGLVLMIANIGLMLCCM